MKKTTICRFNRAILILLFTFCPCIAFSQLSDWTNYTNHDRIYDLLNDGDFLWIATDGGLVRLNKETNEKTFYNRDDGLPDNHLRALAKDHKGNLWIGTQYYGVGKFDGTNWQVYKESNSKIPSEQWCTAITIDEEDNKWIGCLLWLNKFDDHTWKSWTNPGSQISSMAWALYALAFDLDGTMWVGAEATGFYFGKLTEKEIEVYHEVNAPVRSIVVDKNNVKWLASQEGLIRFDGTNFTKYNKDNSELPSNIVLDAKSDQEGHLWLTSKNYLVEYDGNHFTKYLNPMISQPNYCLELDESNHTIWVGTYEDGLFKFKDGKYEKVDLSNSPLTSNDISLSLSIDNQDNIWFGTYTGLTVIDKANNWYNHFQNTDYNQAQRRVNAVATDDQNNAWISLGRSDTCVIKITPDNQVTAFTNRNSILIPGNEGMITGFAFDKKGDVWAASITGLCHYDGRKWERFTTQNSPLKANSISSLVIDKDGNLWGSAYIPYRDEGTPEDKSKGGCLFKYDMKKWTIYDRTNTGLPSNYIGSLAFDSKNNLWIGCYDPSGAIGKELGGGLTKYDGKQWITYNKDNSGLPGNTIVNIGVDKTDRIWLATVGAGLTGFDGTDWINYQVDNSGIAINEIGHIAFDNNRSTIWLTHLRSSGLSTAKIDLGSGVTSHKSDEPAFGIYQHPSSSQITFHFPENFIPGRIEIFDASGKSVYSGKAVNSASEQTYPLASFNMNRTGLYLINVSDGQQSLTRKVSIGIP